MKKMIIALMAAAVLACVASSVAFAEDIAIFDFAQKTTAEDSLNVTYEGASADTGYTATGGTLKSDAYLRASVNGVDWRKLEWSVYDGKTGDEYEDVNGLTAGVGGEVPIFDTSTNHNWNNAFVEVFAITLGYENVTFSASLGGSKKGPRDYKLQYSTNGTDFIDIPDATYSITDNKKMEKAFDAVALPSDAANCAELYIRIQSFGGCAVSGALLADNPASGHGAVNNVAICGSVIGETPTEPSGDEWEGVAAFEFSRETDADTSLSETYSTTADEGYKATKGGNAEGARLFASIDGISYKKLEWSQYVGAADPNQYKDEEGSLLGINGGVPAMDPASDGSGWGNAFFEAQLSTKGYENITLSASLGGSKKGPRNYKIQYSTDGENYIDVSGAAYSIASNKVLWKAFSEISLPDDVSNKDKVYIRIALSDAATIGGALLSDNPTSGQAAINSVYIGGTKIASAEGFTITAVDTENGVSVSLLNSGAKAEVCVITALYDGDVLSSVTLTPVTMENGTQTVPTYSGTVGTMSVKAMLWKSADLLLPLAQSFTDK